MEVYEFDYDEELRVIVAKLHALTFGNMLATSDVLSSNLRRTHVGNSGNFCRSVAWAITVRDGVFSSRRRMNETRNTASPTAIASFRRDRQIVEHGELTDSICDKLCELILFDRSRPRRQVGFVICLSRQLRQNHHCRRSFGGSTNGLMTAYSLESMGRSTMNKMCYHPPVFTWYYWLVVMNR